MHNIKRKHLLRLHIMQNTREGLKFFLESSLRISERSVSKETAVFETKSFTLIVNHMISSAYLFQIAQEKLCDYLLIIYMKKFRDG